MEINSAAPVITRDEALILAPIEVIWDFQTDFSAWPSWQPSVTYVKAPRPFEVGSVFLWETSILAFSCTIQEMDAPRRIVWTGISKELAAIHVWTLIQKEDGVLVHTEQSWEGEAVKKDKAKMQKILDASLREWLQNLKQVSERRRR